MDSNPEESTMKEDVQSTEQLDVAVPGTSGAGQMVKSSDDTDVKPEDQASRTSGIEEEASGSGAAGPRSETSPMSYEKATDEQAPGTSGRTEHNVKLSPYKGTLPKLSKKSSGKKPEDQEASGSGAVGLLAESLLMSYEEMPDEEAPENISIGEDGVATVHFSPYKGNLPTFVERPRDVQRSEHWSEAIRKETVSEFTRSFYDSESFYETASFYNPHSSDEDSEVERATKPSRLREPPRRLFSPTESPEHSSLDYQVGDAADQSLSEVVGGVSGLQLQQIAHPSSDEPAASLEREQDRPTVSGIPSLTVESVEFNPETGEQDVDAMQVVKDDSPDEEKERQSASSPPSRSSRTSTSPIKRKAQALECEPESSLQDEPSPGGSQESSSDRPAKKGRVSSKSAPEEGASSVKVRDDRPEEQGSPERPSLSSLSKRKAEVLDTKPEAAPPGEATPGGSEAASPKRSRRRVPEPDAEESDIGESLEKAVKESESK